MHVNRGDIAWMLIAAVLVLLMTAPGLALFYCGMVRKKNVLSIMMQCLFLMAWMTLLWALWGYSLAFGGSAEAGWNRWIGNTEFLGLRGVSSTWDEQTGTVRVPLYEGLPRLNHMLFQGMYFILTPALICGAFAERMRFAALLMFATLWGTFVYCPLAHWVWDEGPLAFGARGALLGGALDFAGGVVVHVSSGVSALVCALFVGKRLGYQLEPMLPHNLTYSTLGAAMLWVGWFGFNTGNALGATPVAVSASVATQLAAAAGAVAWAAAEWYTRKKPSVLGTSSGVVAGLVCITPAAGYVSPMPAIVIGAVGGVACCFACIRLKPWLGYDDSLDAFGIHGIGGICGALLTGVFATRACNNVDAGRPLGLVDGNPGLLAGQVTSVLVTCIFSAIMTFIVLKIVDALIGLRVSQDAEAVGLDVAEHGEEGYLFW